MGTEYLYDGLARNHVLKSLCCFRYLTAFQDEPRFGQTPIRNCPRNEVSGNPLLLLETGRMNI
jgi:hypothetical protein